MTRFALTVEYDGRPFMGWQRQAHGPSVQQAIEEAVLAVTGEETAVHGAGRTDAGVHALAMRAHVDVAKAITPFRLSEALNARLRPAPVAVLGACCHPALKLKTPPAHGDADGVFMPVTSLPDGGGARTCWSSCRT